MMMILSNIRKPMLLVPNQDGADLFAQAHTQLIVCVINQLEY